ncbi:IucA/IucC family siderophore biosynthesis protein [Verrucosispora sp. WMMA2044]|uniref:IucA/IucC family siderophore biosynthesis protein n=1 Tax=Verrucosispora sioxanthis TaxID=2499994 RepID=A0A6M1L7C5_9ACTN|nr:MULTISPECIES: IucA/IucC family siderophore biosynthesis protein [Micromonospora]NEE64203.1 IucA/IucC family siderophore biosynthesis protein [Verrucosispora sioxanthis]NGM13313.1 IucA/IucC family siderophore biosynthesis protein [Verrucosispora sioxanthis]WBB51269.1 IucA/IucC family siderophore biosynthesis protein [Verrucosispora sp. WMMA2044]
MTDPVEQQLFRRVLDALLREDHLGLSSGGGPDGPGWWQAPHRAGRLRLPVRPDGFQHTVRVARAELNVHPPGRTPRRVDTLAGLLALLAPGDDADAEQGWRAFVDECRQDLLARRLAEATRDDTYARIAAARVDPPTGFGGALLDDVLAAHAGHAVYPTDRCRHGLDATELLRYAPEHAPTFALRWLPVPTRALRLHGRLPGWWPTTGRAGQVLLPVHPLTADRSALPVFDGPDITVRPTLSMRTVALASDPTTHLKLPLPTASLGARNRRTLAPDSLSDGAAVAALLDRIAAEQPRFADRITHADESVFGHRDGDELLSFLLRRLPTGLERATVVPVAALAAADPTAGTVAQRIGGDDPGRLLGSYLDLLLDWHVCLWLRYGVALEAHPQNIHLVLPATGPVRLLYKDNDGARLDPRHAGSVRLRDKRMWIRQPAELADVFVTITLHLAAAAPLLALAEQGVTVPSPAEALAPRLRAARDRWGDTPARRELVDRVLTADRLPVKAMLTAGTLLPKHRIGCTDVNKFYRRTGPNYLRSGS